MDQDGFKSGCWLNYIQHINELKGYGNHKISYIFRDEADLMADDIIFDFQRTISLLFIWLWDNTKLIKARAGSYMTGMIGSCGMFSFRVKGGEMNCPSLYQNFLWFVGFFFSLLISSCCLF